MNTTAINSTAAQPVPPGYKRTEAGVIPEDWDVVAVGDLFQSLRTASNSRADLDETGDAAYVHYGDIHTRWNHILDFAVADVPRIFLSKTGTAARLRDGDLILADASEDEIGVGKSVEIQNLDDGIAVSGLHTILLRSKDERLQDGYRCYLQEIAPVKEQLRRVATGLKVFGISKHALSDVLIPVPSPSEQRAIAGALSDVDGLIGALEKLIAKKRAIKQAAMQQLLTCKTRLPGFSGEWEIKRLGEVADCLDNVRIPLNEAQRAGMQGPYPYCGANGVLDYVNDYVLDDDVILIAEDGGYFDEYTYRPIAYRMSGKIWVNNHAHILKAKTGVSQGFLFYSLVHKNILSYLASGTRAKLNKSEMNKIEVSLPLHETEQNAIATVLSDMDAELAALERRRDKTRAIKQGMMQQLLTGRIRLVEPSPAEPRA